MADYIPLNQQRKLSLNQQGKLALFKPTQIMFMKIQNKTYNNTKKNPKLKNVADLPSTDQDMASIKRLTKKLGAEAKHCILIEVVDADFMTFKKTMNRAENWLLEAEEMGEKRCLFFYYTGHGFQQNWTQAGLNHET